MCGIFGYVGSNTDAGQICFRALKQVEYRGYDSWGIVVCDQELEIQKELGKLPKDGPSFRFGSMVLGHTRWATHGGVTIENTHPHLGNSGQTVVVHNGIVENYIEIRQFLKERGYFFKSETDTEVIINFYEYSRTENSALQAFINTINRLQGNNAVVIMDVQSGFLLASKNGSPMVIGRNEEGNFIASDVAPLLEQCDSIYYVENNEVLVVDAKKVSIYEGPSRFKLPVWQKPKVKLSQVELGSYEHYLLKEVSEQPEILRQVVLSGSSELKSMRNFLREGSDIWFTGCGTAFNAGLLASYFAANAGLSVRSVYAHELPLLLGQTSKDTRIVALSQSGETIDVIDAIVAAKILDLRTAAFVNVLTSSVTRMVECVLPIQAGPELCVLSTKAFTGMVANLYSIYSPEDHYQENLMSAALAIECMLKGEVLSQIKTIAEKLCEKQSLFIIGTGEYYPLALEAALKIKEVSYIHAEAFASGELKHGVIALIEEGTPCLVFAPKGELGDRIRIHASEVRARGGKIISISSEKLSPEDDYIKVDFGAMDYFFAALTAVQLLAYQCALVKNLDPDKPRNLAKCVTVR